MRINVVTCNFENNGGGVPHRWERMHQRLRSLKPSLLFRQEMWGSEHEGSLVAYRAENVLGLRGWLGQGASTAVFADTELLTPVREWQERGNPWVMPPTALTLRLNPAGRTPCPSWRPPSTSTTPHPHAARPKRSG
ncbi:hypothetical protein CAG99_01885 [Streptomyces marincola]|uniref:Endonuclease/exonuclease/phosphatase domain-containing protein n=1 Tax=Streptomyces marincola TaxID=2878388 RepID=A0A1W7CSH1_9ACTN|nr:hypothetical protein CAG99_01885 [Streptomyces marincola]